MLKILSYLKTVSAILIFFTTINAAIPVSVVQVEQKNFHGKTWLYVHHSHLPGKITTEKIISRANILSVTGLRLNRNAEILYLDNAAVKYLRKAAREKNIALYPHISFQSSSAGHRVLSIKGLRNKAVKGIIRHLEKHNSDGIHIDFEYLPGNDAPLLAAFLKQLKTGLGNRKLIMAVFPQIRFPAKWSGFHDLRLISKHIDMIVLMCYDMHRADTNPGSVTSCEWAKKNILHTLKFLPANKIFLGIPAFGYIWPADKKLRIRAVSAKYGMKLAKKYGFIRHKSGNVRIKFTKDNKEFTAFISDKKMRHILADLAKKYRLAGTAIWRSGMED